MKDEREREREREREIKNKYFTRYFIFHSYSKCARIKYKIYLKLY